LVSSSGSWVLGRGRGEKDEAGMGSLERPPKQQLQRQHKQRHKEKERKGT